MYYAIPMTAEHRGWGPPPVGRSQITHARSRDIVIPVHKRIEPIVSYLLTETETRGYDLIPGHCWGYAARKVRGSRTWSNHAWGLAVDLNAPANPLSYKLVTNMPDWMPRLWREFNFRWGGYYNTRKDAMHYEFMGTPLDADKLVARLRYKQMVPSHTTPKVKPMFEPAIQVAGVWQDDEGKVLAAVAPDGAVYAFAVKYVGGMNIEPYIEHRYPGWQAASIGPRDDGHEGYMIINTNDQRYRFP